MSDEKVAAVLQKEAKKRRESIAAYSAAGRNEAASQEKMELVIVEEYLPKMMSEDQVRSKTEEILKNNTFPNFGMAMNGVMSELKGKADGGTVARIVKELYK